MTHHTFPWFTTDLHSTARSLLGSLQEHCQRQEKVWHSDLVLEILNDDFVQIGESLIGLYEYAELEIQRRSNCRAGTKGFHKRVDLLYRILLDLLTNAISGSQNSLEAMQKATPDSSEIVVVSTVWRSKGAEYKRVFCSSRGTVSHRVLFVAYSRSSQELILPK